MVLRKPFVNALAAKRSAYADLMQKASQAKDEAERRNAELKDRLARLDREVEEIRSQARQQAEQEARALVLAGEQLAEHLQKEAHRIAEAEVAAAKLELQKEVLAQVKSQTAEQILKSLDTAAHHRVVQQGLAQMKSSGGRV